MKNILSGKAFLLYFLFGISALSAQNRNFSITGSVIGNDTNEILEAATVYLETVKDSTLITYTISDKNGLFELSGKTDEKEANLFISFVGYNTHKQKISLEKQNIQLPPVRMVTDANTLDEVVIESRAPITIKKDTLEFNVSSFKTKAGATVEDLLKELPGVEVDAEGKILVNGKPVNKLLVNGKPFFGDDPTIATRNLTKEMIEKVQVTSTKTDAEGFKGEEGDQENKTVNLTISEEKNKGTFGRLSAGGGTDERFEYAGIVNRFDNDRRISALGGGNNTNSPGFSFGEIQKMFGGGSSVMVSSTGGFQIDDKSFGFGKGIVNSRTGGASYADAFGEKTDISADYFYSGANSDYTERIQRENIFPDTRFFTNSTASESRDTDAHSANIKFDVKLDSTWLINIKPSFSYAVTENTATKQEETRDALQELINESTSVNNTTSESRTFKNVLDVTKKFGSRGASLSISLTNEWNEQESEDFLNSETIFPDDPASDEIRDQISDRMQSLNSTFASLKYSLPLVAKEVFLDFSYNIRADTRKNERNTFDFNQTSQEYDDFNPQLSTDFTYINNRSTPGLGMTIRKKAYTLSLGGSYVTRTLKSEDRLRPQLNVKQTFEAPEFRTFFNYRFSSKSSLYLNYSLNNTPPSLEQLQPFEDVSDPLNTVTGNPNLEPANVHTAYINYNNYDFQSGSGMYVYSNLSVTGNQVIPVISFDENLVRNTTYTNVNGNYNWYLGGNYNKSFKLDTIHSVKMNVGSYGRINRTVNFNNGEKFNSVSNYLGPSLGLTYTWKEILELTPRYSFGYNIKKFDNTLFDDDEFISHNLRLQTAFFLPKKMEWRNDINYSYNPNVGAAFQSSSWFWNSTVAYTFMKDKAILTFKVYDLLNQNTNARRTTGENYIQDVQSTVLQRYFMLSFSWKFNTLGKKGETDSSMFSF